MKISPPSHRANSRALPSPFCSLSSPRQRRRRAALGIERPPNRNCGRHQLTLDADRPRQHRLRRLQHNHQSGICSIGKFTSQPGNGAGVRIRSASALTPRHRPHAQPRSTAPSPPARPTAHCACATRATPAGRASGNRSAPGSLAGPTRNDPPRAYTSANPLHRRAVVRVRCAIRENASR